MPMSLSILALVVIVAVAAGAIRYWYLTRKNDADRSIASVRGKGALRTFGWTLGLGLIVGAAFIGWGSTS